MAAKKLKHYFKEHPIMVVSTTPLSEIIGCKDASGRVAKWAIELAAHTIQYKPRTTIKSQIIADFFTDWGEHQYLPPALDSTHWRMHFDGSKLLGGLGAGVILTSPKGDKLQMHFRASNNVAEYEALVHRLKMAKEIGIRRILCFRDSDLVVHQVSGDWDAKDANMASYRFYVQQLSGFFEGCEFHHVPRANNDEADRLSKIGSTKQDIPAGVSLEIIRKPSIKPSLDCPSIYVPGDPAPAQVPPPDPGAAASGLKEAAGQPSAAVGDIPNRYTSDVVLNQQARVAHQGWYGRFAIPGVLVAEVGTAVLDAGAYGGSLDMSMADPETGPWWTTDDESMAGPETAHGGLPCSTRIGLGLGLQVVSAPVSTCSPRQAPL
jgi:ribonuclease HI